MNRRLAAGVGQLAAKLALKTASSMKDVLDTLARMERALAEGRGAEKRDVAAVAAAFRLDVGQLAAAMHGDFEKMQRGVAAVDAHVLQKDINTLSERLDRAFFVTGESIFKDAEKDDAVRAAYKQLAALHEVDTGVFARFWSFLKGHARTTLNFARQRIGAVFYLLFFLFLSFFLSFF